MIGPFRKEPKSFQDRMVDLANRLLKLEINVIIKDNMTSLPLKTHRHALIDIAGKYRDELKKFGVDTDELFTCFDISNITTSQIEKVKKDIRDEKLLILIENKLIDHIFLNASDGFALGLPLEERSINWPLGSYAAYDRIREIASEEIDKNEENEHIVLLRRMRDMSDNIKEIFIALADREREKKKVKDLDVFLKTALTKAEAKLIFNDLARLEINRQDIQLYEHEKSMIWKAWDIGTEEVKMQSVIFLDGDVITRVSPDVLKDDRKILLELHQNAVQTSIKYWSTLINLIEEIIRIIVTNK